MLKMLEHCWSEAESVNDFLTFVKEYVKALKSGQECLRDDFRTELRAYRPSDNVWECVCMCRGPQVCHFTFLVLCMCQICWLTQFTDFIFASNGARRGWVVLFPPRRVQFCSQTTLAGVRLFWSRSGNRPPEGQPSLQCCMFWIAFLYTNSTCIRQVASFIKKQFSL